MTLITIVDRSWGIAKDGKQICREEVKYDT